MNQVTEKTHQPQVEIRQILFNASRETGSICGCFLGLVLFNLPWSKAEVTPLNTWVLGPGTWKATAGDFFSPGEHQAPGVVSVFPCSLRLLLICSTHPGEKSSPEATLRLEINLQRQPKWQVSVSSASGRKGISTQALNSSFYHRHH